MTVDVKICGLKTETALAAAVDGGATYVGFVFFEKSPRHVSTSRAAALAAMVRGRAKIVALLVDPSDDLLDAIVAEVDPDVIQLHGGETPERVAAVRRRVGRPVWKAIKVATAADADLALEYRGIADLILFDAKPPTVAGALPGGNGTAFDWRALDGVRDDVVFMLSGGLTPETVAAAVRETGAAAVDVSSGVETAPGEKDPALIRRFLQAAKTANQAASI